MLGPSGCGKTTTLRMIAGFETPDRGRIRLEGADVSRVPPHKRNVNTVFQHYALFPHMTVWDNVAFGPRSRRRTRRRSEARRRAPRDRAPDRVRRAQARPALRRTAAARRAGPRAGQLPQRAAARRAARRAGPQAAPGHADRAQAHPARGRDHVHLRDPRPGGSADDERPDRGDERRQRRPDRHADGDLRPARRRCSWRASSGRPTCGPVAKRAAPTATSSKSRFSARR